MEPNKRTTNPEKADMKNFTVAPDFELPDLNGDIVRLSDYKGSQNIVLVFLRGFM